MQQAAEYPLKETIRKSARAMKPSDSLDQLILKVQSCQACAPHLPYAPRPVLAVHEQARLLIVGQAPGIRVQQSGIPWNDPSGDQLRIWLELAPQAFYDAQQVAIVPMGLCYPGKGKSGDMPPRPECAPLWHSTLLAEMPNVQLTLLIGRYAQEYYLGPRAKTTLTDTVKNFSAYLPHYFPLPHPSPRNRFWFARNPWFAESVLPALRQHVKQALHHQRGSIVQKNA